MYSNHKRLLIIRLVFWINFVLQYHISPSFLIKIEKLHFLHKIWRWRFLKKHWCHMMLENTSPQKYHELCPLWGFRGLFHYLQATTQRSLKVFSWRTEHFFSNNTSFMKTFLNVKHAWISRPSAYGAHSVKFNEICYACQGFSPLITNTVFLMFHTIPYYYK